MLTAVNPFFALHSVFFHPPANPLIPIPCAYTSQRSVPEQPNRGEQALWAEQWLSCCRQLNHWDLLLDYGKSTEQMEVVVDCLWRLSDWTQLREHLNSVMVKGGALEDSPALLMTRAYLALQEGNVQVRGRMGGPNAAFVALVRASFVCGSSYCSAALRRGARKGVGKECPHTTAPSPRGR